MVELTALALVSLALSCVIPPVRLAGRLRRYVRDHRVTEPAPWPGALVVLPVKGQASELPELEDNLRAVLAQDYPRYRVIFAVGDRQDVAVPVIEKLCGESPGAQLVVATPIPRCSNKLCNQLAALALAQAEDEVLVFLDSDARPAPRLLRELVAPLTDPAVGTTTGFRWYTPSPGAGWASWLRAAWNAGGLPFLIDDKYNYAWGGAMAIRREVFERCGIAEYWKTALSDDLGLSLVVKGAGHRIAWAPTCLVRSPEDLDLAGTIEWTNRQTVICRVYNPVMWRGIFVGEAITVATALGAVGLAAWGLAAASWSAVVGGVAAGLILAGGRILYQRRILRVVEELKPELVWPQARRWLLALAPAVSPLMLGSSVRSWVNRRITWRGIRYHLKGPQAIEILPAKP